MDKDSNKHKEEDRKKGDENMNTVAINNTTTKRYCTVEESIKQSCKEIKDYEEGKIKLRSLKESMALWEQWADETEGD